MDSTNRAISEVFRVLKYDGVFVSVSHATALSRVPYFRSMKWSIDCFKIPKNVGEGLSLFTLCKTKNEAMLNRRIEGGDVVIRHKASKVVSNLDQSMNKTSTTKTGQNTGSLTVTTSVDILAEMVEESAASDS